MKFQLTNRQIEEAPRQNIPLIFRNPHILHMKHFMHNVTFDITISESGHLKPKTYLLSNSLLTKSTIGLDMKIKYRVNRLKQNRTVDVFFFFGTIHNLSTLPFWSSIASCLMVDIVPSNYALFSCGP